MLKNFVEVSKHAKITIVLDTNEDDVMQAVVLLDVKDTKMTKMNVTPLVIRAHVDEIDQEVADAMSKFGQKNLDIMERISLVTKDLKKGETKVKKQEPAKHKKAEIKQEEKKGDLFNQPAPAVKAKSEPVNDPDPEPDPEPPKPEKAEKPEKPKANVIGPPPPTPGEEPQTPKVVDNVPEPPTDMGVEVPQMSPLLQERIAEVLALSDTYKQTLEGIQLDSGTLCRFSSLESMPEGVYATLIEKWTPKASIEATEPNQISLEDMIVEAEKEKVVELTLEDRFNRIIEHCKEKNIPLGNLQLDATNAEGIAQMENLLNIKSA